ncbi:MAG: TIGR01777 family oxidoreductase, partial [Ignavibacteria bacterium]
MVKTILLTGATGLIGKYLVNALSSRGNEIIVLTRSAEAAKKILPRIKKITVLDNYLSLKNEKIDAIINLAGMNMAERRWNLKVKKLLYDSRVNTTNKIVELISAMEKKPEVLVSASGVDYYGDTGDEDIFEGSPAGNNFASSLCVDWENKALKARDYNVRVVIIRNGLVLAKEAHALNKMALPFKLFVGGYPGSGKQYLSWVHIDDAVGIYLLAIDNSDMDGPVNGSSPNPKRMKDFCGELGKVLGSPSY